MPARNARARAPIMVSVELEALTAQEPTDWPPITGSFISVHLWSSRWAAPSKRASGTRSDARGVRSDERGTRSAGAASAAESNSSIAEKVPTAIECFTISTTIP